jgi:hypothetical protein
MPSAAYTGKAGPAPFVVIGEGLAAGMTDFALTGESQRTSFPAQMARQMGVAFQQPLFQPPGLGSPLGFANLPTIVPALMQTTVFEQLPQGPYSNLAVPGFRVADALHLRPHQPMIRRNDAKQTLANLILYPLAIVHGKEGVLPSQLECALKQEPALTMVELGFHDALEAAIHADAALLPSEETFAADYDRIVSPLRKAGSDVLLLTVPDPIDTAYFSSVETAAKILKVQPSLLVDLYHLSPDSRISVNGLIEIGCQLLSGNIAALGGNAVYGGEKLREVSSRIATWNKTLTAAGRGNGALVYDLHALFRKVAEQGVAAGAGTLHSDFLGGFYSLNGYYPGATGHAIIANELLCLLNQHYGTTFQPVDVNAVALHDAAAACRPAAGPDWATADRLAVLQARVPLKQDPAATSVSSGKAIKEKRARNGAGHAKWGVPTLVKTATPQSLQLPPGLEQIVSLNYDASYFGDAFLMLNCPDGADSKFGSCGAQLFGGLALTDSHLRGYIRIQFTPPVAGITQFTVSLGNGFAGDDSVLAAPHLFKFPLQNSRVLGVPGQLATGALDLTSGEVSNLSLNVVLMNTGLLALASVNPGFPQQPVSFPGQYGSASAQFQQREDGLLDFSFHGTTFLPLGDGFGSGLRVPLPFAGPSMQFASIPARGTALHPHLHLSTREMDGSGELEGVPEIPCNTIREFTFFTHNCCFGDVFTLHAAELGGPATGRSQMLGRLQIQFGARSGNSVPFAVFPMSPGGIFADLPASPITEAFPGRLSPGPQGFNEFLRFPLRTYPLDSVSLLSDPFDIPVGAVDIRSGRVINGMLNRGFISQDLFFALLRVEPRTPRGSFQFRGPAIFQKGVDGQTVFRFAGGVTIPYPEGFLFPEPNLSTGITIGAGSRLDPYFWLHTIHDGEPRNSGKKGQAANVIASTGDRFSYSYEIPLEGKGGKASFRYENLTQAGVFQMHSLAWAAFADSGSSERTGEYDTVTFAGFGTWSKDGVSVLREASVQISTSPATPYVAIQIDSGAVSNVNTKPPDIQSVLP